MSRLISELQRLYAPAGKDWPAQGQPALLDDWQCTRTLLIEVQCPLDWGVVARLGVAVQADLGLPVPALAVNGRDAYQMWFSLTTSVPVPQACAFLAGLHKRYLAEVPAPRIRTWPTPDAGTDEREHPAPSLPPMQMPSGDWSAFVTPDLAPMFTDSPWLDIAPRLDGQAEILSGLQSMAAQDFVHALGLLADQPAALSAAEVEAAKADMTTEPSAMPQGLDGLDRYAKVAGDPRQFLMAVMADEQAPLALRIEAAKALLPTTR